MLLLRIDLLVGSFRFVPCDMIFIQVGVCKHAGEMNHFLYFNAPLLCVQVFF